VFYVGLGFEVVEKKGSLANLCCGIFYELAFLFFVSWRNRSHNLGFIFHHDLVRAWERQHVPSSLCFWGSQKVGNSALKICATEQIYRYEKKLWRKVTRIRVWGCRETKGSIAHLDCGILYEPAFLLLVGEITHMIRVPSFTMTLFMHQRE
jgi:hypothetical protein